MQGIYMGMVSMSPLTRGAWIETIFSSTAPTPSQESPLTRGAWIETGSMLSPLTRKPVAPHAGGVD